MNSDISLRSKIRKLIRKYLVSVYEEQLNKGVVDEVHPNIIKFIRSLKRLLPI